MNQVTEERPTTKPDQAELDTKIEWILAHFPYERMEAIMQLLQWQWVQPDPSNADALCLATPNAARIKVVAHQLLLSAITHGSASSGGLIATCDNGSLELKFVPITCSAEAD